MFILYKSKKGPEGPFSTIYDKILKNSLWTSHASILTKS